LEIFPNLKYLKTYASVLNISASSAQAGIIFLGNLPSFRFYLDGHDFIISHSLSQIKKTMNYKSRLLIVDDEEHVRDTLEMLLVPEDYQIAFATHGQEALQKVADFQPDIILLDVMMPEMDGYEVCKRLRANPEVAEVPIIMLTALDDRDSRLRGLNIGADDFLSKPVDRMELRARIRTITRLNRYRRLVTERSRFEWAIEQMNDGFLLLHDGDVIHYINSAARLYLGISDENDIAKGFLPQTDKFYKREPELAWENWPAQPPSKSPCYLVRPETENETSLWLQVKVFEFTSLEATEQLVHLHDVTEQMQLQRQMWSFHMQVSHKLRTPLNAITALPALTTLDFSREEAHEFIEITQEALDRLQSQLIDILQYVDTSHLLKLNMTFSVSEFSNLLSSLQRELELNPVSLFMDETLKEKMLLLSRDGIEIILRELLTNAKKFHPQQTPQIEISISTVESKTISLIVSDNGQTLPAEAIAQIWSPYYQNEKFFTGEVKGMGLGLATVAKIVWGSGGHCSLYNRDDQPGISVKLTLPMFST
jgi:CheY-like chemotaxis protein/two-component sensor histidine kinase